MVPALAEWAAIVDAVADGRQLVLLADLDDAPPDGFLLFPVAGPGPDAFEPEFADRARRGDPAGDGRTPTARIWCKVPGVLPFDDDRLAATAGAGIWTLETARDRARSPKAALVFVDPHRLPEPVPVDIDDLPEAGQMIDLDLDIDPTRAEPVLGPQTLRDRLNLIKTAMGVMP